MDLDLDLDLNVRSSIRHSKPVSCAAALDRQPLEEAGTRRRRRWRNFEFEKHAECMRCLDGVSG